MFTTPLACLMAILLELEGVRHLYRNNRATKAAARSRSVTPPKRGLIEADIRLEKGHILGLVGPNGAGKSIDVRTCRHLTTSERDFTSQWQAYQDR